MKRRDFLRTVTGATAAAVLSQTSRGEGIPRDRRRPNVLFILADDLGYGHLGCYGQKIIQTPNLDRLAAEGMRFTQAYAGCTVCAPSRSVLMTGLHMGHTAVRENPGGIPLSSEDVTVAEVLKQAGYVTGCFGKWGLGDAETTGVPTRQGFEQFFGYLHQVHAHFYYPEYLWQNQDRYPLPGNAGGEKGQYSHDEIIRHAMAFIRSNKDRPFFCYLPVTLPHAELSVPEDSLKLYSGKFEEESFLNPRPGYAAPREPKATLAAMITHMDRSVGQVVGLLGELGIAENTIVFFTSDNGGPGPYGIKGDFFRANGPLRDYKTSMYEGGLRVPMIVRWRGRIAADVVSDHVWYFPDVLPTLAELCGAEAPSGIDGVSVVPTLLGEAAVAREQPKHVFLYWEFASDKRFRQAVRMGDWKGVRPKPDGPLELYDLGRDVGEKHNVAAEHPEMVATIETYLKTCRVPPRPQIEPEKPKGQRYR